MMTRRDFTAIAAIARGHKEIIKRHASSWPIIKSQHDSLMAYHTAFVKDLATYFGRANPNFDRDKFLHAAGIKDAQQ